MIQPPEDIPPFEVYNASSSFHDIEVAYSLFAEMRFFHDELYSRCWHVNWLAIPTTIKSDKWRSVQRRSRDCYLIIHPSYITILEKKYDYPLNIVENTSYNVNILKRWMNNEN